MTHITIVKHPYYASRVTLQVSEDNEYIGAFLCAETPPYTMAGLRTTFEYARAYGGVQWVPKRADYARL